MKTIEISDTLFAKLQGLAKPLIDNVEDVIWRLIRNEEGNHQNHSVSLTKRDIPKQFVHSKGGEIRCPLKLRMNYKQTTTYGEARDGWIWFEAHRFTSPSAAAKYVAKMKGAENPSFDGWRILEYFDDKSNKWYPLNDLRYKKAITKTEEKNEYDPNSVDLRFTFVIKAIFGSQEVSNWNRLLQAAVEASLKGGFSGSDFRRLRVPVEKGALTEKGFNPLSGTGYSLRNVDATSACRFSFILAKKLNLPIRVNFRWRNNEQAAHPGCSGLLKWLC